MAVIEDHVDCARVLLFHPGIDVNIKNNKGHTAVMDAQKKTLALFNQIAQMCVDFLLIPMERLYCVETQVLGRVHWLR